MRVTAEELEAAERRLRASGNRRGRSRVEEENKVILRYYYTLLLQGRRRTEALSETSRFSGMREYGGNISVFGLVCLYEATGNILVKARTRSYTSSASARMLTSKMLSDIDNFVESQTLEKIGAVTVKSIQQWLKRESEHKVWVSESCIRYAMKTFLGYSYGKRSHC